MPKSCCSRVEKIPSSFAEAEEFLSLGTLCLGAVATTAERSSSSGSSGSMPQRRAGTLFVVCTAAFAGTATLVMLRNSGSWGGRRGRLVSSVVNKLGQKLSSSAGHFMLGLLGRSVLPRAAGQWCLGLLGVLRGVTWRSRRTVARSWVQTATSIGLVVRDTRAENVCDRRQAVCRLLRRHVVDVRSVREVRGLVGDVSGQRVRVMSAGKGLAQRS